MNGLSAASKKYMFRLNRANISQADDYANPSLNETRVIPRHCSPQRDFQNGQLSSTNKTSSRNQADKMNWHILENRKNLYQDEQKAYTDLIYPVEMELTTEDKINEEQQLQFSFVGEIEDQNELVVHNLNHSMATDIFNFTGQRSEKTWNPFQKSFLGIEDEENSSRVAAHWKENTNFFKSSAITLPTDETFSEVNFSHSLFEMPPYERDNMSQIYSTKRLFDNSDLLLIEPKRIKVESVKGENASSDLTMALSQETDRNVTEVSREGFELKFHGETENCLSIGEPSSLENTLIETEKITINTDYSHRLYLKSSQRFDNKLKLLLPRDWNEAFKDILQDDENLMTTNGNDVEICVGKNAQEISANESFDSDDIKESFEEMEKSFEVTSYKIVTSTPKRNRDVDTWSSQKKIMSQILSQQNIDYNKIEADSHARKNSFQPEQDKFERLQTSHIEPQTEINGSINCINFESDFVFSQIVDFAQGACCFKKLREFNADKTKHSASVETSDTETLAQFPMLAETRRMAILEQIENIFKSLLESLVKQQPMELKIRSVRSWADCEMNDGVLSQKETNIVTKSINFKNKSSERMFSVTVIVMCEIYKMLSRNIQSTRRELYYNDVELFRNQDSVNKAIETLCAMLNVQEYEFGILSMSKGLIAGDLIIGIGDQKINCSTPQAVPQSPSEITFLSTSADYFLIVEKETVFQRLVKDEIFERIGSRIVLVTGKGYPDVNTRVLVKRLVEETNKPIYIIVDADPHGIEIMCTYKYGSFSKIHNSAHLAIPQIEWIGLQPTEIATLSVLSSRITENDLKKIDNMLKRPYMNPKLQRELQCLKEHKIKAEIESLFPYSTDFFINDYIHQKISLVGLPTPFAEK